MYSTRTNLRNFSSRIYTNRCTMFTMSIENIQRDVQRKPYTDHTASFLSHQARFCNPVLAMANGLLLFSAEHRKFAERKWGCGAEGVQRDEPKGTSKSGWSYECEKKRDGERERESDKERESEVKRARGSKGGRGPGSESFTQWQIHIDHNRSAANGVYAVR